MMKIQEGLTIQISRTGHKVWVEYQKTDTILKFLSSIAQSLCYEITAAHQEDIPISLAIHEHSLIQKL